MTAADRPPENQPQEAVVIPRELPSGKLPSSSDNPLAVMV